MFKYIVQKYLPKKYYDEFCKYEILKNLITLEELEEFKQDFNYRIKEREKLGHEFVKLF